MKFRRNLLSRVFRNSDPDADAGGGGFVADTGTPAPTETQVDTTAAPAAGADTGPKDMLEAMFGQKQTQAAPTEEEAAAAAATGKTVQQLRDERGRFAGKAPAETQAVDPTKPAQPKPGVKPEHQMPEGLTKPAQERFQTLVNTNKDLTARVAEFEPIVNSARELQQTFQQNGIKREQFDQAMQVVGLMNRGDLRGALAALDEQRKLISLAIGQPVPGVDLLANHPDLREEVDNLQLTQARAEEIARSRETTTLQRQSAQRQQQAREQQEQETQAQDQFEQAKHKAQLDVDKFCLTMQKSDLDYARIEPLLLDQINGGLLQGVPPNAWPSVVQKTYNLIKQTAGQVRGSLGATTPILRPTGGEAPSAQPKSMFEAQWGKPKPVGM